MCIRVCKSLRLRNLLRGQYAGDRNSARELVVGHPARRDRRVVHMGLFAIILFCGPSQNGESAASVIMDEPERDG